MALLPYACNAPLHHSYISSSPIPLSASATFTLLRFRPCCRLSRVRTPYRSLPLLNKIESALPRLIVRASSSSSPITVREVESLTILEESKSQEEPDSVNSEGGGGDDGDKFGEGGGGGGGGGGDEGEGKEEQPEEDPGEKRKMAFSMSQKLTLGYAALVGLGGLMGYLKSGSAKSLLSGGLSALLLFYVHSQLPTNPVFASSVGLGVSAVLLIVMGARFMKSGKVFPAGVVSLFSLIMSGGYVHGILRSSHA